MLSFSYCITLKGASKLLHLFNQNFPFLPPCPMFMCYLSVEPYRSLDNRRLKWFLAAIKGSFNSRWLQFHLLLFLDIQCEDTWNEYLSSSSSFTWDAAVLLKRFITVIYKPQRCHTVYGDILGLLRYNFPLLLFSSSRPFSPFPPRLPVDH